MIGINGNDAAIADAQEMFETIIVELTAEDAKLLIQVINAIPVQGNLISLPRMIGRLTDLQGKLQAGISAREGRLE